MSEVPKGWFEASLGDLVVECNERVGRTSNSVVLSSTKHHGLVPSDEYFKGRTIYSDDLSNYKRVEQNWFAYATNHLAEGSIGLQSELDSACVSPIYTVFKCTEAISPKLLYRILKTPGLVAQYGLREQASVDRRGAIRFRDFATIHIQFPRSATEQQRITEILDSVDAQASSANIHLGKLVGLRSGLLNELMTSALSESPKATLAEVSSNNGDYGSNSSAIPYDQHLPRYIRITDIDENGRLRDNSLASLDERGIAPYLLEEGDLLIARTGFTTGKSYLYRAADGRCAFAGYLVRFQINPNIAVPEYVFLWTQSNSFERWVNNNLREVGQRNISAREYAGHQLALPPVEEQRLVVDRIRVIDDSIRRERAIMDKLRLVQQGLMDDLLTGRVRLPGLSGSLHDHPLPAGLAPSGPTRTQSPGNNPTHPERSIHQVSANFSSRRTIKN
jgi:restriction endonuclease S subunit